MDANKDKAQEACYITTLSSTKKNSELLGATGSLRQELRRNTDYLIVSRSTWLAVCNQYDREIEIHDVYSLFISFSCNGESHKSILVHGVEKVFDVVLTLFVNKMLRLNIFKKMFVVRWQGREIDPMVSFSWFKEAQGGEVNEIHLVVERVKPEDGAASGHKNVKKRHGSIDIDAMHDFSINEKGINAENSLCVDKERRKKMSQFAGKWSVARPCGSKRAAKQREINEYIEDALSSSVEESSNLSSPYVEPIGERKAGCIGLYNLGNTCFMNSAIQCINNCEALESYFMQHATEYEKGMPDTPRGQVIIEWCRLLRAMRGHESVSARNFKRVMGQVCSVYQGNDEQDSFEFVSNLLDIFHEGIMAYNKKVVKKKLDESDADTEEQSDIKPDTDNEYNEIDVNNNVVDKIGISDNPIDKSNDNTAGNASNGIPADEFWDAFIKANYSVVTGTCYGLTTMILQCLGCGYTKHKHDPFMTLSLPIPPEVKHHPSVVLVYESSRFPMKILVPMSLAANELAPYVKMKYGVVGDMLPVEYRGQTPYGVLEGKMAISEAGKNICLFEYQKKKRYFLCRMHYKRLFFFSEKLAIDLLVMDEGALSDGESAHIREMQKAEGSVGKKVKDANSMKILLFKKLEPYLIYSFSMDELFQYVTLQQAGCDSVFGIPVFNLYLTSPDYLFGSNFDLLKNIVAEKPSALSIYDCIDSFVREEHTQLTCDGCSKRTPYTMRLSLTRLPHILIIQLKRFTYTRTGSKINTLVDFPLEDLSVHGSKYRLIGTCNHIEIGMGYGHYQAYVCRGNRWFCCNDSVVSRCTDIDKRSAYVLFYQAV